MAAASARVAPLPDTSGLITSVLGEESSRSGLYKAALLSRRAHWGKDASMSEELSFYVKQGHPVLSICCAHRHHPLSRCERAFLLLIILIFQFSFAVMLSDTEGSGDQVDRAVGFVAGLIVAVIVTVISIVLNLLVTVDDQCCAGRRGGLLRGICSICGHCALGSGFLLAIITLAATASVRTALPGNKETLGSHAVVFAFSLAQSWTYVYAVSALFSFCMRRRSDIKKAEAQNKKHLETKAKWDAEQAEIDAAAAKATAASEAAKLEAEADTTVVSADTGTGFMHGIKQGIAKAHQVATSAVTTAHTKVTPPFPFSFQELQRWNQGADIDAEFTAKLEAES